MERDEFQIGSTKSEVFFVADENEMNLICELQRINPQTSQSKN